MYFTATVTHTVSQTDGRRSGRDLPRSSSQPDQYYRWREARMYLSGESQDIGMAGDGKDSEQKGCRAGEDVGV